VNHSILAVVGGRTYTQMPQSGTKPQGSGRSPADAAADYDVVVIGSGFSGIAMGIELPRAGR
jgi:hypothetical protein